MVRLNRNSAGQVFSTSKTNKELDEWTDANSPDMQSLMVEMLGNHHLRTNFYTEAKVLQKEDYLAQVAISYETMMTPIIRNKLHRGYHLDEMLKFSLRAAKSYGRP